MAKGMPGRSSAGTQIGRGCVEKYATVADLMA
jgi:hypothetical protein